MESGIAPLAGESSGQGKRGQGKVAVALIALACICSVLALILTWVRNETLDTNRYVETVAPLAKDKAIQTAVTNAVTAELVKAVKPEQLIEQSLPPAAAQLAGPLSQAVTGFVRTGIGRLVASPGFATVWETISRESHEQVVAVLTGKRTAVNRLATAGEVRLDLDPIVGPAKLFLERQGIKTSNPTSSPSVVILDLSTIKTAQDAVRVLKGFTIIFTILAPLLFLLAIGSSRDRRRSLIVAGLSLAGAMAALGILIAVGRWFYLDSLGPNVSSEAAAAFFDTIIRFLGMGARIVAIVGLLVALAAWWSGPGRKAAADLDGEGLPSVLRVAVIGLGAAVLLMLDHPTAIAILLVVVLTAALAYAVGPLTRRLAS